jgi:hypothetical protein
MNIPEMDQGLGGIGAVAERNKAHGGGRKIRGGGFELGQLAVEVAGAAIEVHVGVDRSRASVARRRRVNVCESGGRRNRASKRQKDDGGMPPSAAARRYHGPASRLRRHDVPPASSTEGTYT